MKPSIVNRTGSQRVSVLLPELLQLAQNGRMLSLAALRRTTPQAGQHVSQLLARGMEFAESRRYQSGDDIRNIDWRVTARTGKAHTKLFAAERERRVLLSVDMQPSMFFATQGVFKSVQAALMMGNIAWSAALGGDRLGGIIFDGQNLFESRPALGKRGVFTFLQGLAEQANFLDKMEEKRKAPSPEAMDRAVTHLLQIAKPGSLIFFVSDFRYLTPYAESRFIEMARHCDLCLCLVYDRLEKNLPKDGYFPIKSGVKEMLINTYDTKVVDAYHRNFVERRAKLASLGALRHIHFIECSTEDDCFSVLASHFSKRC